MNSATLSLKEQVLGGLWGALIGDALGVPVEFKDRAAVQANPVKDFRGFGTHHQPPGTWSDDGALLLCTVDGLLNHEFSTEDIGKRFVRWMNEGLWTANGDVFDIGMATTSALCRIARGAPADQAGCTDEQSNGNGSLMRILPVVLRFGNESRDTFADRIERASSITHAHAQSRMACVFYGLLIRHLLSDVYARPALNAARAEFRAHYESAPEFARFQKFFSDDFAALPETEIVSTGYVLHTLHASIWCLMTTKNFRDCVLRAVNLGGDTDTTGCVAGGLAGVLYGLQAIPTEWRTGLARSKDIEQLFEAFANKLARKERE